MYEDPTFEPAPASDPLADAAVNSIAVHAASPSVDASANAAQGQPAAATPAPDASDLAAVNDPTTDHDLAAVNARFNAALARQIAGTLPPGYVYQLGRPGRILLSAGIPDLPIEMASARLLHKSNQENHPFDLTEVCDLVTAIQAPLAVFRSATRLDSKVIMTELQHAGAKWCEKGRVKSNHFDKPNEQRTSLLGLCHGAKWCAKANFVVAVHMNRAKGRIFINDIRSIHPRTTTNILGWIMEDLMVYVDKERMLSWIGDKIKTRDYLNSSTPAEVRQSLILSAKIVQAEHKSK